MKQTPMVPKPMVRTPSTRTDVTAHRLVRRLPVLGLLLALVTLVGIGPAHAGGPTSVLATNYTDGRAGVAITGTAIYDDLVREVAVSGISGDQGPAAQTTPPAEASDVPILLTWFIHDQQPWRIDGIHDAGRDIWISTQESFDGGDLNEVKPMWHKAAHPKKLRSLLIAMGVMIGDADAATSATPAAAPPSPPEAAPPAESGPTQAAAAPESSASSTHAMDARLAWLTGAGALTTLALGFIAGRRTPRRAPASRASDDSVVWTN